MQKFLVAIIFFLVPFSGFAQTSVDYIRSHAQPLQDLEVPDALAASLSGARVVLFGEMHGTQEMPAYTFSVARRLAHEHSVALGFEFPVDLQKDIDTFLKTGDERILARLDFFQDVQYHSGRGSRMMIQLLRDLRKFPQIKIFCFDITTAQHQDPTNLSQRDTMMAQNILNFWKRNQNRMLVTLSGNIHSRLTNGFPGVPDHLNMGAELLRLSQGQLSMQNVRNVLYRFYEGSIWGCQTSAQVTNLCKDWVIRPYQDAYSQALTSARYFLQEPQMTDGHLESIFIRKLTPSEPWLQNKYSIPPM